MSQPILEEHLAKVAQAFDRKARLYDQFGEGHPNLMRMRARVRQRVLACLPAGGKILEINAGTGEDALYFARLGYSVLATDLAPAMVKQIQAKIAGEDLAGRIAARLCSFTQLDQIEDAPYQLVFSNMGGLNCIPNLQPVARQLPRLLVPGGYLVWVIMPKFCLWELAAILLGDLQTARRRWYKNSVPAHVEGVEFITSYHSPEAVLVALGPEFKLIDLQGLSVFTPPADHKKFALRRLRLFKALVWLDDRLAPKPPFNRWGDFYILTAQYQGAGAPDKRKV